MGAGLPSGLVTEAEFLALPESMDRIELIDGAVILPPSPTPRHQLVLGRLFRALSAWGDTHPPTFVGLAPLDLRIAEGRIVQPDLFVLCGGWAGTDGPIDAVPELVVEVLAQRRGYDRITKRLIYAEAEVAEYWIVDPVANTLEQYCGLDEVGLERTRVQSRVLAGLVVELDPLWR